MDVWEDLVESITTFNDQHLQLTAGEALHTQVGKMALHLYPEVEANVVRYVAHLTGLRFLDIIRLELKIPYGGIAVPFSEDGFVALSPLLKGATHEITLWLSDKLPREVRYIRAFNEALQDGVVVRDPEQQLVKVITYGEKLVGVLTILPDPIMSPNGTVAQARWALMVWVRDIHLARMVAYCGDWVDMADLTEGRRTRLFIGELKEGMLLRITADLIPDYD